MIPKGLLTGADDGTRTRNLLITNQLLCQLSYVGALYELHVMQEASRTCTMFLSIIIIYRSKRCVKLTCFDSLVGVIDGL